MLTISDYKRCISQDSGKEFFALTLQGEPTVATSKDGNFYLTANKASIPTSFTEKVCQTLIGKQLSGSIQKVPCESYEFTKETGETVTMNYRYQYSPREENTAIKQVPSPMEMPQQPIPFMPMTNQIVATA